MYEKAQEAYRAFGIDTEVALRRCAEIPVSIHCWQGDDVGGFLDADGGAASTGGIQSTGNYPGKARNKDELFADLEKAFSLIPGTKRLNLHAIYAISDKPVPRDRIEPEHFEAWRRWADEHGVALDFNPTLFSHPLARDNRTLSHPDADVRAFWIRHVAASRRIAASFGAHQGSPALNNLWIPDGLKDNPACRATPRRILKDALDEIYAVKYGSSELIDAVESKVFGIGLESYTVGSADFYLSYAATHGLAPLLDNGHYHPTEMVCDKIPALLLFFDTIALHVTRAVRWDSDHTVLFEDEVKEIAKEIIRCGAEQRVRIGLDYFDGGINRIAAWVSGARNMQKALLYALLMPHDHLRALQEAFRYTELLVTTEELKTLPFGAVWEEYLARRNVRGGDWFKEIAMYEANVLSKRR